VENRNMRFKAVTIQTHCDFGSVPLASAVAKRLYQQQNGPLTHLLYFESSRPKKLSTNTLYRRQIAPPVALRTITVEWVRFPLAAAAS